MNYYHPNAQISAAIGFANSLLPNDTEKAITEVFTRFDLYPHIYQKSMSNKDKHYNPPSVHSRNPQPHRIEFMLDMTNFR